MLDFGANIGDFTVKAALMLNGKGRIIAIEPSHDNVNILKTNLELNNIKNVDVFEIGISDHDGFVNLEGGGAVSSQLKSEGTGDGERVKAYSIDTFLEEAGLTNENNLVVKMDIEGSEKYAFKSANFINKIREISMELHGRENIGTIPMVLEHNGFMVSTYSTSDEIKESLKSVIHHPLDFYRLERQSNYVALRGLFGVTRGKNPIPSLSDSEFKIIYASRIV